MSTISKTPGEASTLLTEQGWTCLDVRSVEEFDAGHPPGAFNIPIFHRGAGGMTPNAQFQAVVERTFPRDAKLVVSCASGVRSVRACEMLAAAGYEHVVNMLGGFQGARDEVGRPVPGWMTSGLPVERKTPPERTWTSLQGAPGRART